MTDRRLMLVATAYAATAAYGAVVSLRRDVPDEAFGIHWPDQVPMTLAVGMGSGTSAPWPMPLAVLIAAARAAEADDRADHRAEWPQRISTAIGWMTILGTLGEPATWGKRGHTWDLRTASALHLLCGAALVAAGHRSAGDRVLPLSF